MTQKPHGGVSYWLEVVSPTGEVLETFGAPAQNLVPIEGLNHMLNVVLKGGTQVATWFIGLYEGDYTPLSNVTAAALPAVATECTTYASPARVEFVEGNVAGGSTNNAVSLAEFALTANKTLFGAFITSAPTKGATTGVLLSVVRFPSPKTLSSGATLRVLAGPTATSP